MWDKIPEGVLPDSFTVRLFLGHPSSLTFNHLLNVHLLTALGRTRCRASSRQHWLGRTLETHGRQVYDERNLPGHGGGDQLHDRPQRHGRDSGDQRRCHR